MGESATGTDRRAPWRKAAVFALAVAAVGLPVNVVWAYGLLLIAAVLILSGEIRRGARRWAGAIAACAFAALLPHLIAPAPIVEGENVFLPGKPGNVLERGLPKDVYAFLGRAFDAAYPPAARCTRERLPTCWDGMAFPDRLYAFSADGVFGSGGASREVARIDFADPVWLRLGFVNDLGYNWGTDAPDVHRGDRDRRFWMGFKRWHIAMPFFLMYEFPAAYAGSDLCWRGDVLWPDAAGRYTPLPHADMSCKRVRPDDTGRPIFAAAIAPESLAMRLDPPRGVQIRHAILALAAFAAVAAAVLLLVRIRPRKALPVFILAGLALVVIAIDDMSFIGGWRPMDGGDDGLFYTGMGRRILQHLLAGDVRSALMGGEAVYYYGGPGLRYFRALEGIAFGDTNLGYLSVVLAMPWLVWRLFARFVSENFAWRVALLFTALPFGEIFGTSFFHYAKWAARGFADPMAHILLVWGIVAMVGTRARPAGAAAAFGAALLLALAVFVKPLVAPMAGIVLAGGFLFALAARGWRRAALVCLGFTPVLLMPLHNIWFGHRFVLFSSNASLPVLYVMPPARWLAAAGELVRLDLGGGDLHAALAQLGAFLSGPSGLMAFVPLHLAAVAAVLALTLSRDADRWLRVLGAALIAEYGVALIYAVTARYFFSMWLLTCLLACVFVERRLAPWLDARGFARAGRLIGRATGCPARAG